MSRILPQSSIDAFRVATNVVLDSYGISCTLYIPNNETSLEPLDAYKVAEDRTYTCYTNVMVYINFKPDQYRLRKLGLYTEGELPITAYFQNNNWDVIVGSYIKVPLQYVPNDTWNTDEFEVVNLITGPMHDSMIRSEFKLAPKRKVQ